MLLTLNMIVKNEAAGIIQTLDSCLGLIDRIDILDTGSTDGTPRLIRRWARDHDLPCIVFRDPYAFTDFATARNFALNLTVGRADWALLLSGDDAVQADPTELRAFLWASRYQEHDATCRHGDLEYGQIRLVQPTGCGRYDGRTHERIAPVDLGPPAPIRITGKSEWSRARLLRDLTWLDYSTPRGIFYIAQTLQCLGENSTAAHFYRERAAWKTGDAHEWWMAILRAGQIDQDPQYLAWAAVERSWRPEPWYYLAQQARVSGLLALADHYLTTAELCPPPRDRGPKDWRIRSKLEAERIVLGHARLAAER